jgi:thiamine biosynthesis lipoprotein
MTSSSTRAGRSGAAGAGDPRRPGREPGREPGRGGRREPGREPGRGGQGALAADDWEAIGTSVRLVVTDRRELDAGRRMLEAELAALDAACSRFRADSELRMLERHAGTPAPVSPLLAGAVSAALRAAELTDGDVDPTVGAAMEAIGYDRDFRLITSAGLPLRLTVRRADGWRLIKLDERSGLLTVPPGVRLDLGATAKAWAADRAAKRLAGELGCGVLVSLGGDIAVGGQPPADGWRVRVQDTTGHPDDPPDGPSTVVSITAGGLATSSTGARRWRRGGDWLHHIVDPRNGLPVEPVWRTVSVAAATALDANTASTAAVIRGHVAPGWLQQLGLPARLVAADGTVRTLAGWPAEVRAA